MKKKGIMITVAIIIVLASISLTIMFLPKGESQVEIPEGYIAVFNGGAGEIVYRTYFYRDGNKYKYINVTSMTESWGSPEWNDKITKKGKVSSIEKVFEVAEKNYANSYVRVPNEDETYTLEEFKVLFTTK